MSKRRPLGPWYEILKIQIKVTQRKSEVFFEQGKNRLSANLIRETSEVKLLL